MIAPSMNLNAGDWGEHVDAEYAAERTVSDQELDDLGSEGRFTHYVYRYWCDDFPEGKRLLYVGFTSDFGSRDAMHRINSWWHGLSNRQDMDVYPRSTRNEARAAEARTIRDEVPLFNIHKNPCHAAVHGQQWTSANVERVFALEMSRIARANPLLITDSAAPA